MNDEFEDLLKRWMRDRAGSDRATLQALAGHVAALPPRRQRRGSSLAAAVAVVAVLGLAAVVVGPRLGAISNQATSTPADPAAFADDPRLDGCEAVLDEIDTVFVMEQARWFPLHFPGWWRGAPELEVDDPALVAIEHERQWLVVGGALQPTGEARPSGSTWTYRMCIAVGTRDDFTVHEYGPTRFDRIIPVLSAEDIARADYMDPEVFADPSTFPAPERLDPCGGLTEQVQYVFEATPASDFPRHFPAADRAPEMDVDDVALIVVYRGRGPMPRTGPSGIGPEPSLGPTEHDLCVVLGSDPATATTFFYSAVDLTGFHVRLDEPSPSDAPTAQTEPSGAVVTPSPAPAWMAGAAAALGCDGLPSDYGDGWYRGRMWTTGRGTPELALAELAERQNRYGHPFPTAGFDEVGRNDTGVAYAHLVGGSARVVVIVRAERTDAETVWFVDDLASCQPDEFGPNAETGVRVGIWVADADAAGSPTVVEERVDCYFATQMLIDGRLFAWAPDSAMAYDPAALDATIGLIDSLPAETVDTGYRSEGRGLHVDPDGTAAYVVLPDGVQRWPHVKGDSYERTDCN